MTPAPLPYDFRGHVAVHSCLPQSIFNYPTYQHNFWYHLALEKGSEQNHARIPPESIEGHWQPDTIEAQLHLNQ